LLDLRLFGPLLANLFGRRLPCLSKSCLGLPRLISVFEGQHSEVSYPCPSDCPSELSLSSSAAFKSGNGVREEDGICPDLTFSSAVSVILSEDELLLLDSNWSESFLFFGESVLSRFCTASSLEKGSFLDDDWLGLVSLFLSDIFPLKP
jgi:hypothetical protein